VGEGLLLDDAPHGTTARVIMPGEVMVMTRAQLDDVVKESPQLYAALVARAAKTISARLRQADATLVGRGRALGFGGHRTRTERDLLGERELPFEALYGVQTLRALENFPITGVALREFPELINALAAVKAAAARANRELGLLEPRIASAPDPGALKDSKTRLQEHLQSVSLPLPLYTVESVVGEPHAQHFRVECRVVSLGLLAHGEGTSRRRAEQEAAQQLLRQIPGAV
jgi:aspartate ammonia-lyase